MRVDGLNLKKMIVIFSVEAGEANIAGYVDIKTNSGEFAANAYIGQMVQTEARKYTLTAKIEHGYTEVYWCAPHSNETVGSAMQCASRRIPADGFSYISIYPNSGKLPAGTTVKILGVKNI